jgi:hypothetical protein
MTKSILMGWMGHVTHMEGMRNACKALVEISEGKKL